MFMCEQAMGFKQNIVVEWNVRWFYIIFEEHRVLLWKVSYNECAEQVFCWIWPMLHLSWVRQMLQS